MVLSNIEFSAEDPFAQALYRGLVILSLPRFKGAFQLVHQFWIEGTHAIGELHAEPRDAEVPYFLAQELIPGYWGNREGTYCPPKGYFVADENPEAFEAYEATFPQKEKLRLPGQLGYEE